MKTKTVREVIEDTGADPDILTLDNVGGITVYVETPSGKTRKVTGAYTDGGSLTLRTGK